MNCPICAEQTDFLADKKDKFGTNYKYRVCKNCRFIFEQGLVLDVANLQKKTVKLYEGDYFENTDEGWQGRGDGFLKILNKIFLAYRILFFRKPKSILDYGGGNGYIASKLPKGFDVFFYDAYEKPTISGGYNILEKPKKADIIYAVELVEHITNINEWDFLKNLFPNIFVFTTGLSDNIKEKDILSWTYFNPNAGHMAIYSSKSLYLLAKKYGYVYFFFPNISCHIFFKNRFLCKIPFVKAEYFIYSIIRQIKLFFVK